MVQPAKDGPVAYDGREEEEEEEEEEDDDDDQLPVVLAKRRWYVSAGLVAWLPVKKPTRYPSAPKATAPHSMPPPRRLVVVVVLLLLLLLPEVLGDDRCRILLATWLLLALLDFMGVSVMVWVVSVRRGLCLSPPPATQPN
jgi:hypothetical protein